MRHDALYGEGVCVWGCVFIWWVCPFQLSRSDLFNGNDFLEFLAPYSFKIVFRFFQKCIKQLFPCWKIWPITQKGSPSLNLDLTPDSLEVTLEKGTRAKNGLSVIYPGWLLDRQTHRQTHMDGADVYQSLTRHSQTVLVESSSEQHHHPLQRLAWIFCCSSDSSAAPTLSSVHHFCPAAPEHSQQHPSSFLSLLLT